MPFHHFYTTSAAERDTAIAKYGFVAEGIACYVQPTGPAPDPQQASLFRLYKPDNRHFYTIDANERDHTVQSLGWTSEGTACLVFTTAASGTVPLYRLYNSTSDDHFYTTDVAERDQAIAKSGYTSEGTACWVYAGLATGRAPFYRLYHSQDRRHFYTTSAVERDHAVSTLQYVSEGIACYVPDFAVGLTPLHRLYNAVNGDHFYTISAAERDQAVRTYQYTYEGVACGVFSATTSSTVPFYRLNKLTNDDHFYTTDAAERDRAGANFGYTKEGTACWVYSTLQPNTVPLYRLYQSAAMWAPIGPAAQQDSNGLNAGRVNWVDFSPNFDGAGHAAMFLATPGGGVWRATDFTGAAPTWTPLTDSLPGLTANQRSGVYAISTVAVDPNNTQRVWAGTGDVNILSDTNVGILQSNDGGTSWTLLPFPPGGAITRILVDPNDRTGKTVYVLGGSGNSGRTVFKTTTDGQQWDPTNIPTSVAVQDIEYIVQGQTTSILAAIADMSGKSDRNGIWISNDGGANFRQMSLTLADLAQPSTPLTNAAIGPIRLTADRRPGSLLGAFATITNAGTGLLMNIFKLTSGQWTGVGPKGQPFITQGGFNQPVAVFADGSIYVAGIGDFLRSVDGGQTWVHFDSGALHNDQHCIAFWANAVYFANDGGVFRFVPPPHNVDTSGAKVGPNGGFVLGSFASLNTSSLQIHLPFSVAVRPTAPMIFITGNQDNGASRRSAQGVWGTVCIPLSNGTCSGDVLGVLRFSLQDGQHAYDASNGGFFHSSDAGLTFAPAAPKSAGFSSDYGNPFALHPSSLGRVAVGFNPPQETRDHGASWAALGNAPVGAKDSITAIVYGSGDSIFVAVGTSVSQIFTTNGMLGHWTQIDGGTSFGGVVVALATDPRVPGSVYLATRGQRVWRTLDDGAHWEDVTGNLPTLAVRPGWWNYPLVLLPGAGAADPTLFVGTSAGVYCAPALQGAATVWSRFGSALPDGMVMDLVLNPSTRFLVAALLGRSCWATTIPQ